MRLLVFVGSVSWLGCVAPVEPSPNPPTTLAIELRAKPFLHQLFRSEGPGPVRSLDHLALSMIPKEPSSSELAITSKGLRVEIDGSRLMLSADGEPNTVELIRLGDSSRTVGEDEHFVSVKSASDDALLMAQPSGVEDLLVVREADALLGYRFDGPAHWRLAQDSPRVVEMVAPDGVPHFRLVAREAWDGNGAPLEVSLTIRDDEVQVVVEDPRAPLPWFIDPLLQDTGVLAFSRDRAALALAQDGRVFIIGGDAARALPIEVYDSRTRRFDVLPIELSAREQQTATVLSDGRIAVAGGRRLASNGEYEAIDSLDLIDPHTDSIDSRSLLDPRTFHTATRLPDGRLLIVGGETYEADGTASPTTATEVIDFATSTSIPGPQLSEPRSAHTATLLTDGRVLVAGGGDSSFEDGLPTSSTAELFDPGSNTWSAPREMGVERRLHAATLLDDGRVVLWGGLDGSPSTSAPGLFLYFDPQTEAFSFDGWSSSPLAQPASALLPNGELLSGSYNAVSLTIGDPLWATSNPQTLLPDGSVFLLGYDIGLVRAADLHIAATTELIIPNPEGPNAAYTSARYDHAATLLPSGRILVTGGRFDPDSLQRQVVELDPLHHSAIIAGTMKRGRYRHTANLLPNGKVLIVGGGSDQGEDARMSEIYDPSTRTFSDGARMAVARAGHTATVLPDGDLLIVGGTDSPIIERYDLESEQFLNVGQLAVPRKLPFEPESCQRCYGHSHSATRLTDGTVLIAGGIRQITEFDFNVASDDIERFDPSDNSIELVGTMIHPRSGHAAVALLDGRVLMVGGTGDFNGSEFFDPSVNFSLPADGNDPYLHVGGNVLATGLLNGDVLFTGPEVSFGPACGMVFNHATGQALPNLQAQTPAQLCLDEERTTRLLDGGIAFTGGWYEDELGVNGTWRIAHATTPSSAEVTAYTPAVAPGTNAELHGHDFVGRSEASNGHTLSSSANSPLAIWLPFVDGPPTTGGLTSHGSGHASWRPSPMGMTGYGALFLVSGGRHSHGAPMLLSRSDNGGPCEASGVCASDVCADGVCCNTPCGGCTACSAARKGFGVDGECEPLAADSPPNDGPACLPEPIATCGRSGLCDGAGQCALYPDGTPCLEGASCEEGVCVVEAPGCDGSEVVAAGETILDCAPYNCITADDNTIQCATSCASNLDCAETFLCNKDGECVPFSAPPAPDAGCAVSGNGRQSRDWGWLTSGALALLRARRRRSRSRKKSQKVSIALLASLASGCTEVSLPATGHDDTREGGQAAGGTDHGGSGGAPSDCSDLDDDCNRGVPDAGGCQREARADGTPCDDGRGCTLLDQCQGGVCISGVEAECASTVGCHIGVCNEVSGLCELVLAADGDACVSGNPCNTDEACVDGVCSGGSLVECPDDGNPCTDPACDAQLGCMFTPIDVGEICGSVYCYLRRCSPLGDCEADGSVDVGADCVDLNPCSRNETCRSDGVCRGEPPLDPIPCADPYPCTVGDYFCAETGACIAGPVECVQPTNACLAAVCTSEGCLNQQTFLNACENPSPCRAQGFCQFGVCNEAESTADGASCDDHSGCTLLDVCAAGECVGTPVTSCVSGDGCCPAGCEATLDQDCRGLLYMASSVGAPGFFRWDSTTGSWSTLPDPPSPIRSQLATDGRNIMAICEDGIIRRFDSSVEIWSEFGAAPSLAFQPEPFFGHFLAFFGGGWLARPYFFGPVEGNYAFAFKNEDWQAFPLYAQLFPAGTFDPTTNRLYFPCREPSVGSSFVMYFAPEQLGIITFAQTIEWPGFTRFGAFWDGIFYRISNPGQEIIAIPQDPDPSVATGLSTADPAPSSAVDPATGLIYVGPSDAMGAFQVFDPDGMTIEDLPSPPPIPNGYLSSLVVVRAPSGP